jgi:hypothetical protein
VNQESSSLTRSTALTLSPNYLCRGETLQREGGRRRRGRKKEEREEEGGEGGRRRRGRKKEEREEEGREKAFYFWEQSPFKISHL